MFDVQVCNDYLPPARLRNVAPCAACRKQHKRCEGSYPCDGCKSKAHKARACRPSTTASRKHLLGAKKLTANVGESEGTRFIMENPGQSSNSGKAQNAHLNLEGKIQDRTTSSFPSPPAEQRFPIRPVTANDPSLSPLMQLDAHPVNVGNASFAADQCTLLMPGVMGPIQLQPYEFPLQYPPEVQTEGQPYQGSLNSHILFQHMFNPTFATYAASWPEQFHFGYPYLYNH